MKFGDNLDLFGLIEDLERRLTTLKYEIYNKYSPRNHTHDHKYSKRTHTHNFNDKYSRLGHVHPEYLKRTESAANSDQLGGYNPDKYAHSKHIHAYSVHILKINPPTDTESLVTNIEFNTSVDNTLILNLDKTIFKQATVTNIKDKYLTLEYEYVEGNYDPSEIIVLYWSNEDLDLIGAQHTDISVTDIDSHPNESIVLNSRITCEDKPVNEGRLTYTIGD